MFKKYFKIYECEVSSMRCLKRFVEWMNEEGCKNKKDLNKFNKVYKDFMDDCKYKRDCKSFKLYLINLKLF